MGLSPFVETRVIRGWTASGHLVSMGRLCRAPARRLAGKALAGSVRGCRHQTLRAGSLLRQGYQHCANPLRREAQLLLTWACVETVVFRSDPHVLL